MPLAGGQFFRRGEVGGWSDELTAEQVVRIEAEQADTMRRLGYVLASTADPVQPVSRGCSLTMC
jgi:hypothetical protein